MVFEKRLIMLPLFVLAANCSGVAEEDEGLSSGTQAATTLFAHVTTDSIGQAMTVSPNPIDLSSANPFFHDFGSNRRTCGTCHQEALGWSITPAFAQGRPASDPLFVFDGSDCLGPGVANPNPAANSTQMLTKANVRIDLGIPAGADFVLTSFVDPIGCATPPSASNLRMYRRPLPAANTAFLTTVMWDGRENVNPPNDTVALIRADLNHQANDATLGHAQAASSLPSATQSAITAFETGLFNAQKKVGSLELDSKQAHGGAAFMYTDTLPSFFIGINDVFSPTFTSHVFTLYAAWENGQANALAASIGRGEALFNSRTFPIDNVRGINSADPADGDPIAGTFNGFCGTCHDTPNIGNHSVALPIDIGVAAASPAGGLDVARLPRYTFQQPSSGKTITLTDPGRALVTGKFKDLGKTKGPILRALATRAPYFHNGAARDLTAVVNFYDARFHIGFTAQESNDLVAFLQAL